MLDTVLFKKILLTFSTRKNVVLLSTQIHHAQEIVKCQRQAIYLKRIIDELLIIIISVETKSSTYSELGLWTWLCG